MGLRSVALVALLLAVAPAASALAHPELGRTDPAADAVLAQPPRELRAELSERLDPASRARVTDGCGRTLDVTTSVRAEQVVVGVPPGAPGAWQVALELVSAEDGHPVRTSYGFTVQGAGSCEDGTATAVAASRAEPPAQPDDPSGSPVLPALLLLGSGALVVVALLVRRRAGG